MKSRLSFIFLALLGLSLSSNAQEEGIAAQQARITEQRAQAEAAFRAEEKACYGKFAVNDCLDAARARRREVLGDLRREELVLNDAQRRRKAAERLQEIEQRSSAGAQRRDSAQSKAPERTPAPHKAPRPGAQPKPDNAEQKAAREKADEAARKRKQQDAERLAQAAEHKAKLEKRQAERTKPLAKPLPVPP